ncbi:MAG: hypothetical protein QOE72_4023, partial [Chloroflexota bacterium]|nr:hypothetical protein [Chloroflexota bacterium]
MLRTMLAQDHPAGAPDDLAAARYREELRRWQAGPLAKGLAYGERLERFETGSGIPVDTLYTPLH